ncbi:MAG: hypothetical protein EON95_09310 [Caulobacteraceae bacterium]|nr:MAG: hypothetical protein EON95_09310 [Caulobacteraceae bacterium]
MRLAAVLALALIVVPFSATPSLAAGPAKVRLACKPGKALKPVVAAITATPEIQDAEPEKRALCLYVGTAQAGPWRRFAIVQMEYFPLWCGTAGCQVIVFLEDQQGQWRAAIDPKMSNNGFAKEEGARLDFSHAVQGLPAITVPQRPDMDVVPVVWTFDAAAGVYGAPAE